MFAEAPFAVGTDYSHALITACQHFAGSVLVLEPDAFVNAVNKLVAETPDAESPAEAVMAWCVLKDAVARGAEEHHAWFHRCVYDVACRFRPRPLRVPMTFGHLRVDAVLNEFAAEYAREFDAAHCWPPAIRASALLCANADRAWHVEDLARAVYVSSATLARSFSRIFNVTVLQYQARLRLRAAVDRIRSDGSSIEGILIDRGYRSPKDAYRLFRRLTGMTLSDVRRLSDDQYASLMDGPLARPTFEGRTHSTAARKGVQTKGARSARLVRSRGSTRRTI